jgi:hypothetical protein
MEVRWTSMPPNGCAVIRRTPGTKGAFARSGACFLSVTFLCTSVQTGHIGNRCARTWVTLFPVLPIPQVPLHKTLMTEVEIDPSIVVGAWAYSDR